VENYTQSFEYRPVHLLTSQYCQLLMQDLQQKFAFVWISCLKNKPYETGCHFGSVKHSHFISLETVAEDFCSALLDDALIGFSIPCTKHSFSTQSPPPAVHFSLSCIGEGNGNPLQYSCLENPRDRGAWWAAVHSVVQSQTRLKQLSMQIGTLMIKT